MEQRLSQRKCKNCKNTFEKKRPLQYICSPSCAFEYTKKKKDAECEALWKVRKKKEREKLKKLSELLNALQSIVNKLVRRIDFGQPCISSGVIDYTPNAGHYYPVKSNPEIRFNLFNIYIQSVQDNHYKSGNIHGYREGLKATFGMDHFEMVENLKSIKSNKLNRISVIEKIRICRELLKEIQPEKRSNKHRLELRDFVNNKLN